jgi:putative DNA primase/helicase
MSAGALGDARREGRVWRCRCPLHGGRSLTLCDGDGGCLLVNCWGSGCERVDVLAELRRRGLLRDPVDCRPRIATSHRGNPDDDDARRIARARAIWRATLPAADGPVERYLTRRGIKLDACLAALRWHPHCPRPDGTFMSAMLARVDHIDRGMVGIHRTYITSDYRRHDRASLGPIGGGAVRFGTPNAGQWFAVAEGIETALSVVVACSMPAWAALSASGIKNLMLPCDATHVLICADHDTNGTGERAAHGAATRWLAEGRRVRIAVPPELSTDFNDVLTGCAVAKIDEARHVA